jgi:hypothetical protein
VLISAYRNMPEGEFRLRPLPPAGPIQAHRRSARVLPLEAGAGLTLSGTPEERPGGALVLHRFRDELAWDRLTRRT